MRASITIVRDRGVILYLSEPLVDVRVVCRFHRVAVVTVRVSPRGDFFPVCVLCEYMAESVLERVCGMRWIGVELLVIDVVLLVLLLWSFLSLEAGSSTYYVALLSLGIIAATLLGGGALMYKCHQLQQEKVRRSE